MGGLWGGRFSGELADSMVPLNRSLDQDYRLWPEDVRGSKAWAGALARAGVLTAEEEERMLEGLDRVAGALGEQDYSDAPDEDVHSLVERLLQEEIGPLAGKLHTGRSRNDQVATDLRMWGISASTTLAEQLEALLRSLLELAERSVEVVLPGYTHLQQAQPIRGAHWALSHFWPLHRDLDRVRQVARSAGALPLGSGALAGCPFPVDREWLRESLGFDRVGENSLDAVSDRDWVAEMTFAGALMGVHLSRFGEDLVLFSAGEFGYLELPEGFCTGSSLMPQKRNPDAAELVRGKAGRLLGNLTGVLTLLKGLPTGYNRDLQEDKVLLFDTVDTLRLILPALTDMVSGTNLRGERARERLDPVLLATDLADYLVRKGLPFRETHEVVGKLVRLADGQGISLAELSLDRYKEEHPSFDEDVYGVFSFDASVEARASEGGTAREAVEAQIRQARRALDGDTA